MPSIETDNHLGPPEPTSTVPPVTCVVDSLESVLVFRRLGVTHECESKLVTRFAWYRAGKVPAGGRRYVYCTIVSSLRIKS